MTSSNEEVNFQPTMAVVTGGKQIRIGLRSQANSLVRPRKYLNSSDEEQNIHCRGDPVGNCFGLFDCR